MKNKTKIEKADIIIPKERISHITIVGPGHKNVNVEQKKKSYYIRPLKARLKDMDQRLPSQYTPNVRLGSGDRNEIVRRRKSKMSFPEKGAPPLGRGKAKNKYRGELSTPIDFKRQSLLMSNRKIELRGYQEKEKDRKKALEKSMNRLKNPSKKDSAYRMQVILNGTNPPDDMRRY